MLFKDFFWIMFSKSSHFLVFDLLYFVYSVPIVSNLAYWYINYNFITLRASLARGMSIS